MNGVCRVSISLLYRGIKNKFKLNLVISKYFYLNNVLYLFFIKWLFSIVIFE